jgi:hypothetical protein
MSSHERLRMAASMKKAAVKVKDGWDALIQSALVAVRALLGFEVLRTHAEHVVALNAYAVQDAARFARWRRVRGMRNRRLRWFRHALILA